MWETLKGKKYPVPSTNERSGKNRERKGGQGREKESLGKTTGYNYNM